MRTGTLRPSPGLLWHHLMTASRNYLLERGESALGPRSAAKGEKCLLVGDLGLLQRNVLTLNNDLRPGEKATTRRERSGSA